MCFKMLDILSTCTHLLLDIHKVKRNRSLSYEEMDFRSTAKRGRKFSEVQRFNFAITLIDSELPKLCAKWGNTP